MERDAKYAAVAVFALVAIAAAFLFVWWYSGQGDRRDFQRYEIYFHGSVSGLARASPVRYLGVDVGRVEALEVDRRNPGRVKVVAEIDSSAPISGATEARLGLLGLTGLLYIDLTLNEDRAAASQPLPQGEQYPVIRSRKGDIEAFLEELPNTLAHAGNVLDRLQRMLSDDNLERLSGTLGNLERASAQLPATVGEVRTLATDLRGTASSLSQLAASLQKATDRSAPELHASLTSMRDATAKLARTADALDRIVVGNESALSQFAGSGPGDLQQLLVETRAAAQEVRELARSLRENPSLLLREQKEAGVEIKP